MIATFVWWLIILGELTLFVAFIMTLRQVTYLMIDDNADAAPTGDILIIAAIGAALIFAAFVTIQHWGI